MVLNTADFDFELPDELIAQTPLPSRDGSRMLVLNRGSEKVEHRDFRDLLGYVQAGDVLVLNDSRVIPARLRGSNNRTGGQFEILLLDESAINDWWVMLRPGKRARVGTKILLHDLERRPTSVEAEVVEVNDQGQRRLVFAGVPNILSILNEIGEVPLPPYINRANTTGREADRQRYQTVFSNAPGSVAAPTAGLHFTESLLSELRSRGAQVCFVTLHVGLGTFAPVKVERLSDHVMHEERFEVSAATARTINEAKQAGRRIFAVGTTTLRVLETLAAGPRQTNAPSLPCSIPSGSGKTRIFIYPPYHFKIVDALLTNFHLPRSTLVMLASAFAAPEEIRGRTMILSAYQEAIRLRYRFFSYGDAMLIS